MVAPGRRALVRLGGDTKPVVVAVPLSASRLRERGFNQAESLAVQIAEPLGLPVVRLLGRAPGRHRQAGAGIVRRRANVQGSFFLSSRRVGEARSVLLVDDVLTTGGRSWPAPTCS